ncbi:hypothetical protein V6N13_061835 [Hibiscus sabdariffa]|uniref:Uncharacterized protein n=2 Tax=Hibiscus sabdariffa TaxID=183260 RepID=A0ABR2NJR1_9ROSI
MVKPTLMAGELGFYPDKPFYTTSMAAKQLIPSTNFDQHAEHLDQGSAPSEKQEDRAETSTALHMFEAPIRWKTKCYFRARSRASVPSTNSVFLEEEA